MPQCPMCKVDSVKKQYTWKGVLWAVLCFPCGIYCCYYKNRRLYCPLCGCQVVYQTGQVPLFHRYFRFYQSFGQTSPAPSEPIPRVASQSPQTTTTSSTAPIITQ